jgi:hypothetical protein
MYGMKAIGHGRRMRARTGYTRVMNTAGSTKVTGMARAGASLMTIDGTTNTTEIMIDDKSTQE